MVDHNCTPLHCTETVSVKKKGLKRTLAEATQLLWRARATHNLLNHFNDIVRNVNRKGRSCVVLERQDDLPRL